MNNNNNEGSREEILGLMKGLKLTGMMESYDENIADTIRRKATSSYCLHQLLIPIPYLKLINRHCDESNEVSTKKQSIFEKGRKSWIAASRSQAVGSSQ